MQSNLQSIFLPLIILLSFQVDAQQVITTDIDHFWKAYDKIGTTKDSVLQYRYLDELYLSKGTAGLKAIRQARNYSPQDYINAINSYPKFWTSIRANTLKAGKIAKELETGIGKLRKLYPELKPATIYFTVGALRTNGTFSGPMVLIGSEMAMADKNTVASEFPENSRTGRRTFFDSNPIDDLVLLNTHEYVHTQQKPAVRNLLSYALNEGVAEFVSVKTMAFPLLFRQ